MLVQQDLGRPLWGGGRRARTGPAPWKLCLGAIVLSSCLEKSRLLTKLPVVRFRCRVVACEMPKLVPSRLFCFSFSLCCREHPCGGCSSQGLRPGGQGSRSHRCPPDCSPGGLCRAAAPPSWCEGRPVLTELAAVCLARPTVRTGHSVPLHWPGSTEYLPARGHSAFWP